MEPYQKAAMLEGNTRMKHNLASVLCDLRNFDPNVRLSINIYQIYFSFTLRYLTEHKVLTTSKIRTDCSIHIEDNSLFYLHITIIGEWPNGIKSFSTYSWDASIPFHKV
ncbi:hypothetical protein EUGRSUZ_C01714 [Eucalyptus grandis]|uniref:Uncharacterized protein n=2 Tax=Eucalyptus grandis TaxID=71139 RepID=A0ACC3LDV7_EUCGR|nr:hypothetical protein EUGRSUZ_C01714 [Eucalyptus grandis]